MISIRKLGLFLKLSLSVDWMAWHIPIFGRQRIGKTTMLNQLISIIDNKKVKSWDEIDKDLSARNWRNKDQTKEALKFTRLFHEGLCVLSTSQMVDNSDKIVRNTIDGFIILRIKRAQVKSVQELFDAHSLPFNAAELIELPRGIGLVYLCLIDQEPSEIVDFVKFKEILED
jgi:translation initiation factor RLI1